MKELVGRWDHVNLTQYKVLCFWSRVRLFYYYYVDCDFANKLDRQTQ